MKRLNSIQNMLELLKSLWGKIGEAPFTPGDSKEAEHLKSTKSIV